MDSINKALEIIDKSDHIILNHDKDYDGMTCGAIFEHIMRDNPNLSYFRTIDRFLSEETVDIISDNIKPNTALLTADMGSDSTTAYKTLKDRHPNLKIIVTDHHQIPDFTLLQSVTDVVVNPHSPISTLNKHYSGANVFHKLFSHYSDNPDYLLGYVAMANIIDQMSMLDKENINTYKIGSEYLKEYAIVKRILKATRKTIPHDRFIAINFGPVINSCNRLDQSELGVNALLGDSKSIDLAIALNKKRKVITQNLYDVIKPQLKANKNLLPELMVVMISGDENKPYCGLLAGRISADLEVPTLTLINRPELLTGSGRGIPKLKFKEILNELGVDAKGHSSAFGITVPRDKLIPLIDNYRKHIKDNNITYDKRGDPKQITIDDIYNEVDIIEQNRPYGNSNPYPEYEITFPIDTMAKYSSITKMSSKDITVISFRPVKKEIDDTVTAIATIEIDRSPEIVIKKILK